MPKSWRWPGRHPTTNSRNVAGWFGKRHYNVMRDIAELSCSPEFTALTFEASSYTDSTGRSLPCVDMTNDGLVFLIMGFTGRKAAAFNKNDKNVLRDIRKVIKATGSDLSWFILTTCTDAKGETREAYEMTREGFDILVMGWTGDRAMPFKVLYIREFHAMTEALRPECGVTSQME